MADTKPQTDLKNPKSRIVTVDPTEVAGAADIGYIGADPIYQNAATEAYAPVPIEAGTGSSSSTGDETPQSEFGDGARRTNIVETGDATAKATTAAAKEVDKAVPSDEEQAKEAEAAAEAARKEHEAADAAAQAEAKVTSPSTPTPPKAAAKASGSDTQK